LIGKEKLWDISFIFIW